jgi:hypothetical protein
MALEEKMLLKWWNDKYYAKAKMPDGSIVELNSINDLNYQQWRALFVEHWQNQLPQPDGCPMHNPDCPNYTGGS